MTKKHFFRDFVVGLLFLGGIAVIAYATLWLERVPWKQAHALTVRFPEVDNLKLGEPVLIHGVRIGQVETIEYTDDPSGAGNHVIVRLTLDLDLSANLNRETRFSVRSAGPLGGRVLEIDPGPSTETKTPTEPGYVFTGEAQGDIFKQVGKLADMLSEVVGENRDRLKDTIEDVRTIVERVEKGEGLLGEMVANKQLAEDGRQIVTDARTFITDLSTNDGLLSALLSNTKMRDHFQKLAEDLSNAVSPENSETGAVSALLYDKNISDDLRAIIDSGKQFTSDVASGDGLVGKLLRDAEFAKAAETVIVDASQAMTNARSVAERINRGEGLLGEFINDEEVFGEIKRIVVIARESLEDLREQAPISTFANVLFTAF